MRTADQSPPAARTPEEALAAIRALCEQAMLSRFREEDVRAILDSVQPTPQHTVDSVRLRNYLWGLIGQEPPPQVVEDVIRYLRPVEGVVLSGEEAALAARCARSLRGGGSINVTSLDPYRLYERLQLLAEKCEAAS